MNEGKWLEDILREIDYPPTDKPWLRPIYDHPEFIARNVYRLYGGWYSGDPAEILPAHPHHTARQPVGASRAAPAGRRRPTAKPGGSGGPGPPPAASRSPPSWPAAPSPPPSARRRRAWR